MHNPFSTRYTLPGAIPWLPPSDITLEDLIEKFQTFRRRAAIVGPHGSGKSTLLASLRPHLALRTRVISTASQPTRPEVAEAVSIQLSLRHGCHPVQRTFFCLQHLPRGRLLILDGFEQLPCVLRPMTAFAAKLRSLDLLVTSHHKTVLPTLLRTTATADIALQVASLLLRQQNEVEHVHMLDKEKLGQRTRQLLSTHNGNVREVLMQLYDDFEETSRT